jgi:non-specific serine/threonine protein kinase
VPIAWRIGRVTGRDSPPVVTFGDLLRRHRLAAGLTQEELAERARVSPRAISDLERGLRSRPWRDTVQHLADALQLGGAERAQLEAVARRLGSPSTMEPRATRAREDAAVGRTNLPPPRHNLPVSLTSFIGREAELAEVKGLLRSTRLLTLTGAGGCGKTRLALQVATESLAEYPDGVWQVELAVLTDPALVPLTVSISLGLREEPGQPILHVLASAVKSKHLLLILDNCEHLVDACAELADRLLRASLHLRILATSREALSISGEASYRVPPLSLPASNELPHSRGLFRSEAVRLFVDRATSAEPTFALTSENAAAVAQICQQLDGIPLALELAAPYLKGLSVYQLAVRLDDRFRILSRGSRTALPHHQTLRALIDWSYNLLDDPERVLFGRLAVFVGGFTVAAAEAVCAGGRLAADDVLLLLVRLVDKSLVVAEGGAERYRLLETLRHYAHECLSASGQADAIREKHARYYLAEAELIDLRFGGPQHTEWLKQLEGENGNLRGALAWFSEHDAPLGLRLANTYEKYWFLRGYAIEGDRWLQRFLDLVPDRTALRAKALLDTSRLLELQRKLDDARAMAEESLGICREIEDVGGIVESLCFLGSLRSGSGASEQARCLLEEAQQLARAIGNVAGLADVVRRLGLLAMSEGNYGRARGLLEESLVQSKQVGYQWGIAASLGRLGAVARLEGDYRQARTQLLEGIAAVRAFGSRPYTGTFLASLGNLARCEGKYCEARALLEESLREARLPFLVVSCLGSLGHLAIQLGATIRGVRLISAAAAHDPAPKGLHFPELQIDNETNLPRARAALGEQSFARAWAEGQAMSLEEAIAYALEEEAHDD